MAERRRGESELMRRALQLAERGRGRVEPNPMVGCVIARGGRIIAEGYHRRFGGPHAEVDALCRCAGSPRGATVYVTLEPCCHFGKTPPCTHALVEAGVGRVVAAMRDPSPRVAGRGLRILRKAGIRVETGLLGERAAELNAPFLKLLRQKRPWVILKWAQSLDGKIATRARDSKWISDERCRRHAHRVRARVDAIVVGRRTVEIDDPRLTARGAVVRRVAVRVVLDGRLRISLDSRLVRGARHTPTWVLCGPRASDSRAKLLERAGCVVHRVASDEAGLRLEAVLDLLGVHGMTNVLVEGGGELLGEFVDRRLADELQVYIAPLLIGGREATPALAGEGARLVREALVLPGDAAMRRLGNGWFVRARLHV